MSMHDQQSVMKVPTHVGYIIDGNRRWARKHGLPTYEGHLAGYDAIKQVVIATIERGVAFVSIYAFSTENWKREEDEVKRLMKLMLRMAKTDLKELIAHNIRVRFVGIEEGLDERIVTAMRQTEEKTAHLKAGTALICFNYGGQREIVDAARRCVKDGLKPEEVNEAAIAERLYVPDVPPVDIVVRTSGEQRISNFMLWRIAYSEFLFLDKFWPEMTKEDVGHIIQEYNLRRRRFGG